MAKYLIGDRAMIILTAKITLADGTEIALDKRNLLNMSSDIIDRADIVLPSWGLISNGGNISFVDYDGTIKRYAQSLMLTSQTKVNIYLTNTLKRVSTEVGEFFSSKWSYDNNNSEVVITITDGLQKLQDISFNPLQYDLSQDDYSVTALDLYNIICNELNANGFNVLYPSSSEFDRNTRTHLSNIVINYPYINKGNLWRILNDFGIAFQLHIYKNRKGVIVCVYSGGD